MNTSRLAAACGLALAFSSLPVLATERFVSLSGGHVPPFINWTDAATNIQEAIDTAADGDVIWVTNGVYVTGGKVMAGDLTNRVALDKALTVQSVNGPFVTTIQGAGATNGVLAVRCAWLTNGATLTGFTLQAGATRTSGSSDTANGGGAWCNSNAVVANCVIKSNAAVGGGGVYSGVLKNCFLTGNKASLGAGAYNSVLRSCTVTSNSNHGIYSSTPNAARLTNCIVYFNSPVNSPGGVIYTYCCITPPPSGAGNIGADPQLLSDGLHIASASPCRGAGTNLVSGTDIDGQTWSNPPSIGCDEWQPTPLIFGQPKIGLTSRPIGFAIGMMPFAGQEPFTYQWMKDRVFLQDDAHFHGTDNTNLTAAGVSGSDSGDYQIVVSNAFGVVTSTVARLVIHYVSPVGSSSPPYLSWQAAATNIQDGIDVAGPGEFVLVTNGVYASGGKVMAGDLTNRVALEKALMVLSVNGPAGTLIQGAWDPVTTNGPLAVRCAWLTNGAILSGFTLQNGATRTPSNPISVTFGGGAWCNSSNAVVANCWLSGNAAASEGGGAYRGTLESCILTNNTAVTGGGTSAGTLNNCLVILNSALSRGGGAYLATLNNSTVIFNYTCFACGASSGAGTFDGITRNSIVLYNSVGRFGGQYANYHSSTEQYSYCLTDPNKSGTGNITGNPQRVDVVHISVNSPCRGAGSPLYATGTDIDGEAWTNPPSIGCDEVVEAGLVGPLSVTFITTRTNVLVNHPVSFDAQITGRIARFEWLFGDGSPATFSGGHVYTNVGDYTVTLTAYNMDNPAGVSASLSIHVLPPNQPLLQSVALTTNGFQFDFPGQESVQYWVEMATNLTPPVTWQTLQTIFYSTGGVHQITDSVPTNASRFYRVKAQ